MKNIILIWIVFLGIGFIACDEREISLFEDSNELFFDVPYVKTSRNEADTIMASFFFYKESVNMLEVSLCVCLSGDLLEEPTTYELEPIAGETSLPEDLYELGNYQYPKRQVVDTITFQVFKSERLKTRIDTLTLTFKSSDRFRVGQQEYAKRVILVTAEALQPTWWNHEFSFSMLGTYSAKKMRLFVDLIAEEVDDVLHFDKLDPALQRKLCLEFKYWLAAEKDAGRTVYDEDGLEMAVEVIG